MRSDPDRIAERGATRASSPQPDRPVEPQSVAHARGQRAAPRRSAGAPAGCASARTLRTAAGHGGRRPSSRRDARRLPPSSRGADGTPSPRPASCPGALPRASVPGLASPASAPRGRRGPDTARRPALFRERSLTPRRGRKDGSGRRPDRRRGLRARAARPVEDLDLAAAAEPRDRTPMRRSGSSGRNVAQRDAPSAPTPARHGEPHAVRPPLDPPGRKLPPGPPQGGRSRREEIEDGGCEQDEVVRENETEPRAAEQAEQRHGDAEHGEPCEACGRNDGVGHDRFEIRPCRRRAAPRPMPGDRTRPGRGRTLRPRPPAGG